MSSFWWRWIVANGVAELLGLGTVAAVGFLAVSGQAEPAGLFQSLVFAGLFISLGAFEGLVVGLAQSHVLSRWLPNLKGWVRATVIGAVAAWVLGMLPSTILSVVQPANAAPPEMSPALHLMVAAGLGMIAGPVLAFFQWRRLRTHVSHGAGWWIPANAAAWALGMPAIFLGVHCAAAAPGPLPAILTVGSSLLAAGLIVGTVHGYVMGRLISRNRANAA